MDILAPLSGIVVPLDAVPDPVFSAGLAGDGVAIDPTSDRILAPVAGRVTGLHRSHHAVTITSPEGVEILVHVGLDTVALEGRGFTPLVEIGAEVRQGDPLLRFDADLVACNARSLVTPILVTGGGEVVRVLAGERVEAGAPLMRVLPRQARAEEAATGEAIRSEPIVLPNPSGIHARPAAVLAEAARRFSSEIRLLRLDHLDAPGANVKSVVGLIGLSTRKGDRVLLEARGPDAAEAVTTLAALLASGCGENPADAPEAPPNAPAPVEREAPPPRKGELRGVPASQGIAIGRIVQHHRAAIEVAETGGTVEEERARFREAMAHVVDELEALRRGEGNPSRAAILGVQRTLLDDPDLLEAVERMIEEGRSAAWAWKTGYEAHARRLEQLDLPLLRERAADVRDVGRRLLAALAGVGQSRLAVPAGSILVARDLTPSETAALDPEVVAGFCVVTGGPTSHVAIVARSLGIPAIAGIDEAALSLPDGTEVILDGTAGTLRVEPDEAELSRARERILAEAVQRESERAAAFQPAHTRDGARRVEVAANIRTLDDARKAIAAGADGVGLLRSEFLLGDRQEAPGLEEEAEAYLSIAKVVGVGNRLVVRTLDVGGDKPLPWIPIPREQNPFLGMRGIRVSLEDPERLRSQVRAILRAAEATDLHILFPMIASVDELRQASRIVAEERGPDTRVQIGVMIEVPAAAILADVLAREVDFFSIGTNDLTQYTLAVDRGHPVLGKRADALHPAVLQLIDRTVRAAHDHGKWVGVCGGIASEPIAVPVLVGLGVDELSVSVPAIGPVKAAVGRWSWEECTRLATEALACETADEVRALLRNAEEQRSAAGRRDDRKEGAEPEGGQARALP